MKRLLLILGATVVLLAQGSLPFDKQVTFGTRQEIGPVFLPNVPTDILAKTVWVRSITLTNESGSDTTCSVVDKQSPARALVGPSVTVGTKQTWLMTIGSESRKMAGGVTWSCAAASAVTGYIVVEF